MLRSVVGGGRGKRRGRSIGGSGRHGRFYACV